MGFGKQYRGLELLLVGAKERVKVVAFYRWLSECWYAFTLVQDCKKFLFILKEDRDNKKGGFFPH